MADLRGESVLRVAVTDLGQRCIFRTVFPPYSSSSRNCLPHTSRAILNLFAFQLLFPGRYIRFLKTSKYSMRNSSDTDSVIGAVLFDLADITGFSKMVTKQSPHISPIVHKNYSYSF